MNSPSTHFRISGFKDDEASLRIYRGSQVEDILFRASPCAIPGAYLVQMKRHGRWKYITSTFSGCRADRAKLCLYWYPSTGPLAVLITTLYAGLLRAKLKPKADK